MCRSHFKNLNHTLTLHSTANEKNVFNIYAGWEIIWVSYTFGKLWVVCLSERTVVILLSKVLHMITFKLGRQWFLVKVCNMICFPISEIVSFCVIMCLYLRNFKHLCTKFCIPNKWQCIEKKPLCACTVLVIHCHQKTEPHTYLIHFGKSCTVFYIYIFIFIKYLLC